MKPVQISRTPIVFEDLHQTHPSCIQVHKICKDHHLGVISHFYQGARACAIIMISNSCSYAPELNQQLRDIKSGVALDIPVLLVSKSDSKYLESLLERRSEKFVCEISPVSTSHHSENTSFSPCETRRGKQTCSEVHVLKLSGDFSIVVFVFYCRKASSGCIF